MVSAARPLINILRLRHFPILRQLQLEEALLRADEGNWCIINDGAANPAIVMGISGRPHQLLHLPPVLADGVQVIKRFSGGGTVVVDENTVFVTLICSSTALPSLPLYPRPIMKWTEDFYRPVFEHVSGFHLREHDYVFGDLKFGGNAQSITKNRWLHHTSFLWDYDNHRMTYLKHPQKTPGYRQGREHGSFISRMKDYMPSKEECLDSIERACNRYFICNNVALDEVEVIKERDHPQTTVVLEAELLRTLLAGESAA